jgi:hypothetical protein
MVRRGIFVTVLLACTLGMMLHGRHVLNVECLQEGKQLLIKAFFYDDDPAEEAKVEVLDVAKTVLVSGKTDNKGIFRTDLPAPGTYTARVDAGAGHRTEKSFVVTEDHQLVAASISRGIPWLKIGLGLGIIALTSAGLWVLKTATKNRPSTG